MSASYAISTSSGSKRELAHHVNVERMVLERKIRLIGGRPVWRAEVDGRLQARLISYGDSEEEAKVRRTFSFLAAWRSSMAWIMVGS